ncbi:serine/threonine-protein kinase [uncultured Paludibaculum sp.]|uniref:serine/threonine-protein kinase n=1 Tax=uncultured Paludibaculum sp. TaxID=1765020 RepID=UPI002AAB8958|nr:serine/threonine-protein kinase [uncultured Paludibaculum sp.]
MNPLPDPVMQHLVRVAGEPDLNGTPYELETEIGRGGMGVVYSAFDRRLQRSVALKVLYTGAAVLEEARVIASLEHPGIVPVYETGELPDGRPYYSMRLVEGSSLDTHLGSSAPLSERLRVFQKICDTVAFAHSRGVVHRDLKPGNIMVGGFGEVVILDWGIAHRQESVERPGIVAGTPRYMAPEMLSGQGDQASHSVDIYSLGALLLSCLPANPPRALRAIAEKAMSSRPDDRYANCAALNLEISRFLDGAAVEAHHESAAERLTRFAVRNRTLLLLLAAYLAVRVFLFFLRTA